jgi:hypothetical protein
VLLENLPKIQAYDFGHMCINDTQYTTDLIICPDGTIISSWWRISGHKLQCEDLQELILLEPEIIIAGTGALNLLKPADELKGYLLSKGIQFLSAPTASACETYNQIRESRKVGACFHLTC